MNNRYLYAATALGEWGEIDEPMLADCSERHRLKLVPAAYRKIDNIQHALSEPIAGIVIEMIYGWPSRAHLQLARQALRVDRRTFFYWPREEAIEHIDNERLDSYQRLWLLVHAAYLYSKGKIRLKNMLRQNIPPAVKDQLRPYYYLARSLPRRIITERKITADMLIPHYLERQTAKACKEELTQLIATANPIALRIYDAPTADRPIKGIGAYLRTDFWAKINSGGSYGHTND